MRPLSLLVAEMHFHQSHVVRTPLASYKGTHYFKTLLYKLMNGLFPRYIDECLIVKRPHEGSVTTRSDNGLNLRVPRTNKGAGDRAFSVVAPYKWNSIPLNIRSAQTVTGFKSLLKTYLFLILFLSVLFLFFLFLRFVSSGIRRIINGVFFSYLLPRGVRFQ